MAGAAVAGTGVLGSSEETSPDRGAPETEAAAALGPNLLQNGDFETGVDGWRTLERAERLGRSDDAPWQGRGMASLTRRTPGLVTVASDAEIQTRARSRDGARYHAELWVRSGDGDIAGALRLGERGEKRYQETFTADDRRWRKVEMTYDAVGDDVPFDLDVRARLTTKDSELRIDRVRLRQARTPDVVPSSDSEPVTTEPAAPTTRKPATKKPATKKPATAGPSSGEPTNDPRRRPETTSTSSPDAPTSATGPQRCVDSRLGVPGSGAYVGAAASGAIDIGQRERQLGDTMAIRRMYFQPNSINTAVRRVRAEHAAGRLPWISFKLPTSWRAMAGGAGDDWARRVARSLNQVNGPIWIAFHHEPETERQWSMSDWVAMQRRLSPIIRSHSDNIAFTVIYSGWNLTKDQSMQHIRSVWPGSRNVDVLGFDMYNDYGVVRSGKRIRTSRDPMDYIDIVSRFAREQGVPWGIGEIGFTRAGAEVSPRWLTATLDAVLSRGGVAMSYFDSTLATDANWYLEDAMRRNAFGDVLARTTRLCR